MRNCQPFSQMSVVFLPKVAQHIVTISNDIFYCPFCMFIVYGSNVKYSPPVRNCETTLTFTGPPDVLCGTSKTSSCGYFCNNCKIFCIFFHFPKILFSLSTISNVETKAFSFLLRIPPDPGCFLFPMIFVGMPNILAKCKFSGIAVKTQERVPPPSKILEKQPNFRSSVQQRRTWPAAAAFFNNESKKLSTKEICATSKDFATIPTAKRNPSKVGELYVGLISIKKTHLPISVHTRIYRCHLRC